MSKEYNEYLKEHIGAVQMATRWMIDKGLPCITENFSPLGIRLIEMNVVHHDQSKYERSEYGPYDAYFYGEPDEDAFNYAWLHHIHNNNHHWQHWLLMQDDGKCGDPGKFIALEMPKIYAIEMVADWWSFSWRSGNLFEMFDWYEEHKDCMVLHPETQAYVERVLEEIRAGLEEAEQK